ncbi:unnamed protein product [Agarophyton chilense]
MNSRLSQRYAEWRMLDTVTRRLIEGLNGLYAGHVFSLEPQGEERNAVQRLATTFLRDIGEAACRRNYFAAAAAVAKDEGIFYYGDKHSWKLIKPDLVSLPVEGLAASADVLTLLPENIRVAYESRDSQVKPKWEREALRKPFCGVEGGAYKRLIEKLEGVGIISLQREQAKVTNGVFAVPKKEKGSQRLIIDARNANNAFFAAPDTQLPNPADLARLYLPSGTKLYVGKTDMDNQYHKMKMPEWSRTIFAQNVHRFLLERAGLKQEDWIPDVIEVSAFRYGAYVDDYFSLGTCWEKSVQILKVVVEESRKSNLPSKPQKISWPGESEFTEVLGIEVYLNGLLMPDAEKLRKLIGLTKAVIGRRRWNVKMLQRLLGKWAWFLLLQRPLFSVLSAVYKLSRAEHESVVASKTAKQELSLLVALSPLIRVDLTREFVETVLCVDASCWGGGVVYTATEDPLGLLTASADDKVQWINAQPWKLAIRHKWHKKSPIHILEGEACILGLRWALRQRKHFGKRLIIFIDNQALIGALKKGRSSVYSFNRICRRVAALLLAGNMRLEAFYVPSVNNPADEPSRTV